MNTEDREIAQGPVYLSVVPDADGFAEAVRAFKFSGITSDAITINAAVNLVNDRALEAAKDEARDGLLALVAGQSLSPEIKAELEKRIHAALGGATSVSAVRAIASSISTEIRDAGDWSAMEKNLNDQQTREERLNQIWGNLDKLNDAMSQTVRKYLTEDERKEEERLKKAKAEAKSEEEKEAAQEALNHFYKDKGIELEQSSDPTAQAAGAQVKVQVQQAEHLLESAREITRQDKKEVIIGARDTKAAGASSIFDTETELGNMQKNTTAALTDKSATKVASIFDEPETGNLVPNIPPQPKGPSGGRSV